MKAFAAATVAAVVTATPPPISDLPLVNTTDFNTLYMEQPVDHYNF